MKATATEPATATKSTAVKTTAVASAPVATAAREGGGTR